jgi:hypothetical protein
VAEDSYDRNWTEARIADQGGCVYPDRESCCGKVVAKGESFCPYHLALRAHLKATRCTCACHKMEYDGFLCSSCGCPIGPLENADA